MSLPIEFYHQKAKIIFRNWEHLFDYSKAKISSKDSFDAWIRNPQSIIIRQSLDDLKLIKFILENQKKLPLGYQPSLGVKFFNLTKSTDEIKYYKFLLIKAKIVAPDYLLLRKNEDVIPFCFQDLNALNKLLEDLGERDLVGKHNFIYLVSDEDFRFESDGKTVRILKSMSLNDARTYYSKKGITQEPIKKESIKRERVKPSAPSREKVEEKPTEKKPVEKKPRVTKPKTTKQAEKKTNKKPVRKIVIESSSDEDDEEEDRFKVSSLSSSRNSRSRNNNNSDKSRERNYYDLCAKYGI